MFSTAKNLNLLSPLYKRLKKTRKNFRMPPQKKPPKNGFSFYMDDYIPGLKRQGIQINHKRTFFLLVKLVKISLEEAVPHLLQQWKALSKLEKEPYE